MGALEHLTSDRTRFLSEVYGKRPDITATGRDYSWLGSLDAFDHLINDTLLPSAAFRLVKDGKPIPVRSYTKKFGSRDDTIKVADAALVFDLFGEGATIVLEGMHRYSAPVRDLCRDLERELRQGTQVNAYVTPPGAQGFATHVDSHDVFVVQVFGTKHWLVHDSSDVEGAGEPLIERDLQVGDCLYIPKGFPHSATTGTSASGHLTIGILETTSKEMKRELVSMLKVGTDTIGTDVDAASMSKGLVAEMRAQLDALDEDELARGITRLFFASRHHSLRGHMKRMLDADAITDADKVVSRVEWVRFDVGDEVVLVLPDRELRFGARLGSALDVVLGDEPFRVADLGPGLDEDERVAMVARLIKEGLLELR